MLKTPSSSWSFELNFPHLKSIAPPCSFKFALMAHLLSPDHSAEENKQKPTRFVAKS